METRIMSVVYAVLLLVCCLTSPSNGQWMLIDDFNDGDDQGWMRIDGTLDKPWGPGSYDATSGSYHLQSAGVVTQGGEGSLESMWQAPQQTGFLRANVRSETIGTNVYLLLRSDLDTPYQQALFYAFGADPSNGQFFIDGGAGLNWVGGQESLKFGINQDWTLEAGIKEEAEGLELSLKAWPAGTSEPKSPQLVVFDPTPVGPGQMGLGAWIPRGGSRTSATFDDIYFRPVPEPSSFVLLVIGVAMLGRRSRCPRSLHRLGSRTGITILLVLTAVMAQTVDAGKVFLDDFEDGSHTDGSPVTWSRYVPPLDLGNVRVSGGDLIVTPPGSGPPIPGFTAYWETDLFVEDQLYHDVDIHVQARQLGSGFSVMGVGALDSFETSVYDGLGLYGWLRSDNRELALQWHDNDATNPIRLDTAFLSFSQATQDVHLRLAVTGETASLTAWAQGNDEPAPQISMTLPPPLREHLGRVVIFSGNSTNVSSTAFRSVQVVPEPVGSSLAGMAAILLLILHRRRVPVRR